MGLIKTDKKYIKRKTLIYKTNVEYGDYTINHILGCSHGCKYPCYAFLLKKRFGEVKSYEDWCNPAIVENTLELLDREIPKFKDKIRMLHLCFTSDPFMYGYPEIHNLSTTVIKKLNCWNQLFCIDKRYFANCSDRIVQRQRIRYYAGIFGRGIPSKNGTWGGPYL